MVQLRQIVKTQKSKVDPTTPQTVVKTPIKYEKKLRHDFQMLGIIDNEKQANQDNRKGSVRDKNERNKVRSKRNVVSLKDGILDEGETTESSLSRAKKLQRLNAKLHLKCILNDMINAFQQIKRNSSDSVSYNYLGNM